MKPELRQAIFERFRQGDGGINRKAGGTGLGLAIAKEFVEMHKGRIEVLDSDLGGARFQVTHAAESPRGRRRRSGVSDASLDRTMLDGVIEELRYASRNSSRHGRERPSDRRAAGSRCSRPRVLVVEDNPDMNRFVTQCLSRDYEVISAFDGREGLEKALRFRPMLVVSDIMMPNVSGVEMIAEMRGLPELQPTPVLLLSAKADEELMVRLLDEGAQDFIVKPFAERELLVRVRNLVQAEQARGKRHSRWRASTRRGRKPSCRSSLLHSLFMQAPTPDCGAARARLRDRAGQSADLQRCGDTPRSELLNRPLFEVMPEFRDQGFQAAPRQRLPRPAFHTSGTETPATVRPRRRHASRRCYFNFVYSPFRNIGGRDRGRLRHRLRRHGAGAWRATRSIDLREAAESANRAKDEFLAMLGHELRNPLSPILTALQLMKLRGDRRAPSASATVIERQVNHLTRLVDDLLDVSRIARGKVELKTEIVEMAEVVAKAIEMASPLLEQRTHTLTVDVPRRGLRVDGDPTRLSQVVSNLLTNAAKYTPPGGQISVRARAGDDDVVLPVRDTGIGIAPEVLPHVFDLFVQERQAHRSSQGGLGHRADDRAQPGRAARRIGVGAQRRARARAASSSSGCPAATAAATSPARARRQARCRRPRRPHAVRARILVVDDNEDGAEMLAEALERARATTRAWRTTRRRRCASPRSSRPTSRSSTSACR